jgi:MFS family permease
VITAAAMDLLDSTIAQVAAPTIRSELGGSYAVIEWVTAAYALAMAAGLLTGGRLGDMFGRRRGAADRDGRVRARVGGVRRGAERG